MREKIKQGINRVVANTRMRNRVVAVMATVILFVGFMVYAALAQGIGFRSPFTDATDYGNVSVARFTFPDTTSDSGREYVPQINWVIKEKISDNGKNAVPVASCSDKLQKYLNVYQVPQKEYQFVLFNATKPDFMGWQIDGTGKYTLWPSTLTPITDTNKRREATQYWLRTEYFSRTNSPSMLSSARSWYNSNTFLINLSLNRYRPNGGTPYPTGAALDAYFLPPDLLVKNLWTTELGDGKMQANAVFENTFWADVRTNVYLYAVVNGIPQLLDSRIGVNLWSKLAWPNNVWQLQAEYPAGTTKLVACVGVPWNGMSWQSSVNNDTTTTATVPELGLTLRGKKIELGSDQYRPDTKNSLANRWNNNYKELLDPEQPGAPPEQPSDIAALMLMPIDSTTQQVQAYITPSSKFKMKFTYISGFDESGNATVRLYREDKDTYVKTLVSEKSVYVTKGQADVIFDTELQHNEGVYRYIATINYRWGSGWIGEQFAGKEESTYDNNKVETDVRCTVGGPPAGVGYWPPVVKKQVPVYEKFPVWGWKKVEYDVEELKIKTRLVE